MENIFTLQSAVLLISVGLNLLLVLTTYQSNRRSATNIIFILLGILVSVWLVIMRLAISPNLNLFWTRMSIAVAMPMSLCFFLLAHTLPSAKLLLKKKYFYAALISTAVISVINLSPFAFTGIETVGGVSQVVAGPGMLPFSVASTFFSLYAVYVLFKKYNKSVDGEKNQLRMVLLGMFSMLSLIILTILIPVVFFKNNSFVAFAPLYALIFLTATAVSILKYHLFDIKVIATEALVTVLMMVLLFEGMLSGSIATIIFKTAFAILVGIIGILLVRSVHKEIKQKNELSDLAASLEKANIRLQELDKQKTDFLSVASHQLRTPLSILKGYIELIKDGAYGKVDLRTVKVLGDMDINNEHLVKLVDEFLDITRIEQGRTKYDFVMVNICGLIDSAINDLKIKAGQKKIKINWECPKKLENIYCDQEKIHHVIFNFIDNAIKYSDQGIVKVMFDEEDGGVALRVFDQGIGFEKQDEVNFYQKFYRGDNVKAIAVTGTGLGLYVCRKFIEAHNGRVWARSDGLGKGSQFGFWVPLNPKETPPEHVAPPAA